MQFWVWPRSKDFDFAKSTIRDKDIVKTNNENENFKVTDEAYAGPGILINSNFLNGLKVPEDSIIETIKILEERNLGKKQII